MFACSGWVDPHARRRRGPDGLEVSPLFRRAAAGFAVLLAGLFAAFADLLADIVGLCRIELGLGLCGCGAGIVAETHEQREMIGADFSVRTPVRASQISIPDSGDYFNIVRKPGKGFGANQHLIENVPLIGEMP